MRKVAQGNLTSALNVTLRRIPQAQEKIVPAVTSDEHELVTLYRTSSGVTSDWEQKDRDLQIEQGAARGVDEITQVQRVRIGLASDTARTIEGLAERQDTAIRQFRRANPGKILATWLEGDL